LKTFTTTNGFEFRVSDEDAEVACQHRWCRSAKGYILCSSGRRNGRRPKLHQVIAERMGLNPTTADHVNRDRSDNRRENLRTASRSEQNANRKGKRDSTSGLKGVSLDRTRGLWKASIQVNGKYIWLGRYPAAEEAHAAYCEAAIKHFGEFACAG
jgi:hypothetical protein